MNDVIVPSITKDHVGRHIYGLRDTASRSDDARRFKVLEIKGDFAKLQDCLDNYTNLYHVRSGALKVALDSGGPAIFRKWFASRVNVKRYFLERRRKSA